MYSSSAASTDPRKVIIAALIAGASFGTISSVYHMSNNDILAILNSINVLPRSYQNIIAITNSTVSEPLKFDPHRQINISPTTSRVVPVSATVYNAVPQQTDRTPYITADGTNLATFDYRRYRVLAISQDLLKYNGGPFTFGDRVFVEGTGTYDGVWHIHDTMNPRFSNKVDFLVPPGVSTGQWENVTLTPLY